MKPSTLVLRLHDGRSSVQAIRQVEEWAHARFSDAAGKQAFVQRVKAAVEPLDRMGRRLATSNSSFSAEKVVEDNRQRVRIVARYGRARSCLQRLTAAFRQWSRRNNG